MDMKIAKPELKDTTSFITIGSEKRSILLLNSIIMKFQGIIL